MFSGGTGPNGADGGSSRGFVSPSGRPHYQTVAEAAQTQNEDAVIDLLKDGKDANTQDQEGNTALHWAAWFRRDALLSTLLARGARPDIKNSQGETAVHWAAKSSNITAIQVMTKGDHGMLSQRDCDGFTPFVILAQNDNAPVMEWMYLRGISVEEQDNWGRTALHWACYKGHHRTVQWLLSRSANIAHRDHEGMTPIHWAALKGHDLVADMLINVGAVDLLHIPDAAGDSPIDLAMRKKNRYMVIGFHKCQLFNYLFGRPFVAQNNFASLFFVFVAFNIAVFAFIILPGIWGRNPGTVIGWTVLMGSSLGLWVVACRANPGWLAEATVKPQKEDCSSYAFDADQPVESQMVHVDGKGITEQADLLARLELEQSKHNYQRQLLTAARRKLEDGSAADRRPTDVPATPNPHLVARGNAAELQPLMAGGPSRPAAADMALAARQLDSASFELRRRAQKTGESLGRERVATLLQQGQGEYLQLLEKGSFKQVCVACRVRRELRSHHCKECGRCVRRLDHHCPWIDNCVGIGNQRTFYCFIVVLLATILGFYRAAVLYVVDAIVPAWASGEAIRTLATISEWSAGPELRPCLVILCCALDSVWLAFVGALVVRHTAYMAVNITTYEVLTRPAHVCKRFPRHQGRCWFLRGCELERTFLHCLGYWTLDLTQDAQDFSPTCTSTDGTAKEESPSRGARRGGGDLEAAEMPGGPGRPGLDNRKGGSPGPRRGGSGVFSASSPAPRDGCDPDTLEDLMACHQKDETSSGNAGNSWPSPQPPPGRWPRDA
jgi:hypothetical protein